MLDEAGALDLAALVRGLNLSLKLKLTIILEEVPRHGAMATFSVPTWPSIIKVPLKELAKSRKRGGRDLITDIGEEYGRCARESIEERRRNQKDRRA